MLRTDYYEILGVSRRASDEEVDRAYRRLVRQWHPDLHPTLPDAEDRVRRLNEAREVLGDPASRARYDCILDFLFLPSHIGGPVPGFNMPRTIRDRRRSTIIPLILTIAIAAAMLFLILEHCSRQTVPLGWLSQSSVSARPQPQAAVKPNITQPRPYPIESMHVRYIFRDE